LSTQRCSLGESGAVIVVAIGRGAPPIAAPCAAALGAAPGALARGAHATPATNASAVNGKTRSRCEAIDSWSEWRCARVRWRHAR
jgi:hypothetical protein